MKVKEICKSHRVCRKKKPDQNTKLKSEFDHMLQKEKRKLKNK